jgi:hypothetical protein
MEEVKSIFGTKKVLNTFFKMLEDSLSEFDATMLYLGSKWSDEPELRNAYYDIYYKEVKAAKARGVNIRIIGRIIKETETLRDTLKSWGIDIRHLDFGFLRFAIMDNRECIIIISEQYTPDVHFYRGVWTNNKDFVGLFKRYFDDLWNISKPITDM